MKSTIQRTDKSNIQVQIPGNGAFEMLVNAPTEIKYIFCFTVKKI